MSSKKHSDADALDLERHVPTTKADIAMLRQLRDEVPSWFSLTPAELTALLPEEALARRPLTPAGARPFVLP